MNSLVSVVMFKHRRRWCMAEKVNLDHWDTNRFSWVVISITLRPQWMCIPGSYCATSKLFGSWCLFCMAQPVGIQSLGNMKSTKTSALGLYISFRLVFLLCFSAKPINWAVNIITMIPKHFLCLKNAYVDQNLIISPMITELLTIQRVTESLRICA